MQVTNQLIGDTSAVGAAPVLVADADGAARSATMRALRGAGMFVTEARSGPDAIGAARGRRPAVALLEVELPGLCGYEVLIQLREDHGPQLPVILLSALRTDAIDRVAGLLLGADDYVTRPYSADELLARVRGLLRRGAVADDGPTRDGRTGTTLTVREHEVLRLLACGAAEREIAGALFITPKTVATHIQHILAKLDVHSRAQAVSAAHRFGLVGDGA